MPVDADFFTAGIDDVVDRKFDQVVRALRRGVTCRVAEHHGAGAAADRGGVEALDGVAIGANGVFGHVHRRKTVVDGVLYGFFRGAFEVIDRPILDEATDGAGAEEGCGFEGDAYSLRDLHDGADVGFHRARGTVRANLHAVGGDFARQGFGVRGGARAGSGQPNIEGIDAERFHQVQDFDFFFDAGIVDRGILQAIAQSFVVEKYTGAGRDGWSGGFVPVVDVFGLLC